MSPLLVDSLRCCRARPIRTNQLVALVTLVTTRLWMRMCERREGAVQRVCEEF